MCTPFQYGDNSVDNMPGANVFVSEEQCSATCAQFAVPDCPAGINPEYDSHSDLHNSDGAEDRKNVCLQVKSQARCAGHLDRWYYDKDQGEF